MTNFTDIQWLFFDIGSTLVDESKAYEHRIKDTINGSNIYYEQFYNAMISFAKQGLNSYNEAVRFFGLNVTPWHSEDEFLFPETISTLNALSERYKIGIIANQLPGINKRLNKMRLAQYISLTVSSAEEGVAKPDPAIFELALERAGCTAENTIMIGDRLDNDIIPAKRLGMYTIWVRQGFGGMADIKNAENIADYTVKNIGEIPYFAR